MRKRTAPPEATEETKASKKRRVINAFDEEAEAEAEASESESRQVEPETRAVQQQKCMRMALDEQKASERYAIGNVIGSGTFGQAFELCDPKRKYLTLGPLPKRAEGKYMREILTRQIHCPFVAKATIIEGELPIQGVENIEHGPQCADFPGTRRAESSAGIAHPEIELARSMAQLDVGPTVVFSRTCPLAGDRKNGRIEVIGQQRLPINIIHYASLAPSLYIQFADKIKHDLYALVDKMAAAGFIHADLWNQQNMLLELDDQANYIRAYLIDFGKTCRFPHAKRAEWIKTEKRHIDFWLNTANNIAKHAAEPETGIDPVFESKAAAKPLPRAVFNEPPELTQGAEDYYSPNSPVYAPRTSSHEPQSPVYAPHSPSYGPNSPSYTPSTPENASAFGNPGYATRTDNPPNASANYFYYYY